MAANNRLGLRCMAVANTLDYCDTASTTILIKTLHVTTCLLCKASATHAQFFIELASGQGTLTEGRLSIVDLLIKVACLLT